MTEFDGAWHKWARAVEQAESYDADIRAWATNPKSPPVLRVRADYQPHRHAFAIILTEATEIPTEFRLRLGEIAFNFRCAIDHVAWALVQRGTALPLTPDQEQRITFPIADTRSHFRNLRRKRLPGVRRADETIVRRYQPYHWGKRKIAFHPLKVLAELNNHDKHREIQPSLLLPSGAMYRITHLTDCVVTRPTQQRNAAPLYVDTEIGALGVRRTGPNPKLEMEISMTGEICLKSGIGVIPWLGDTTICIGKLLRAASDSVPEDVRDKFPRPRP